MSESKLQFRVGLFVIAAMIAGVGLLLRFGELRWAWEEYYTVAVHFEEAPGVHPDTIVRKSGVAIGHVKQLYFDDQRGGVTVVLNIQKRHQLREDSRPRLTLSLLGDASVEFSPGLSPKTLPPGTQLTGEMPANPLDLVNQIQTRMDKTLTTFEDTSREWQQVAAHLNNVMETNRGNIDVVVERAAESLHEMTVAMRNVNQMFGNPELQRALQETANGLPDLVRETRATIVAAKGAVSKADQALGNLAQATAPLARESDQLAVSLQRSLGNLEVLLAEMSRFAKVMNDEDGTLKLLATDPELYRNMNRSAGSMDTLLRNLQPVLVDLRILSDKLARHPELLGVSGALNGSNGLKSPEEAATTTKSTAPTRPAPLRTATPGTRFSRN